MESMKREVSCTQLVDHPATSPKHELSPPLSEPKTAADEATEPHTSLAPPSLDFPALKFELEGGEVNVNIQSPDNTMWDSMLFSDHFDASDFMIISPVRNLPPSPQLLHGYSGYNFAQNLFGVSPPRALSPLGLSSSSSGQKAKGVSPLHKVFTSVNNQYNQHPESFSVPPIEELLENLQREHQAMATLDPTPCVADGPSSYLDEDLLDMSGFCVEDRPTERDSTAPYRSSGKVPLSQQLEQEREREKKQQLQQQQIHNIHQNNITNNNLININSSLPICSDLQEQDSGLQLVHLLLACAEAVSKEDYMLARRYLHHLNRIVTPLGDSMQRVASCFTEALSARLAATLTVSKPPVSPSNSLEVLKIYQIVYQACPYIKFAHFTANQAIFEAFEAEDHVHVIDLDILQGYQWPAFMQALSARPGTAPFLRITGVGGSASAVHETGRCLTELAHSLNVPFEFHGVAERLEDLRPHMFHRRVGEALAVNSVNRLHRVPTASLGTLLAMIRDQAPSIVTLVEQEASHNGPYFLGRFLEALHYYSAIFDSLDATFPAESPQRMKVEQYIFAPEIRNIVACEQAERTERHERLEKWRKIMEGKGFRGVALSANAVTQSKILLGLYSCDGYRLTEDKGCLLLGWQDRPLIAASAWRC